MKKIAVIGGGIGGFCSAVWLKKQGHDVHLYEKDGSLGGCAGTFYKNKMHYNSGATTISGCVDGTLVHDFLASIDIKLDIELTNPALVVHSNNKTVHMQSDLQKLIASINDAFPSKNHDAFWIKVRDISTNFMKHQNYRFSSKSPIAKFLSYISFLPIVTRFGLYSIQNAISIIKKYYPSIDEEYLRFLDAQIRIVTQCDSRETSWLNAALALGYSMMTNGYAKGGMGAVFKNNSAKAGKVHLNSEIISIEKINNSFSVQTKKLSELFDCVVVATPIDKTLNLFKNEDIKQYIARYCKKPPSQSAFMVYMSVKTEQKLPHHIQILLNKRLENTTSDAIFISISVLGDTQFSAEGKRSFTISIHTDERYWNYEKHDYYSKKELLHNQIKAIVCEQLQILDEWIVDSFAATPATFERYLGRKSVGGFAMNRYRTLDKIAANDSPFGGLYFVGDTVFAGQGWPGVIMGVMNFTKLFCSRDIKVKLLKS